MIPVEHLVEAIGHMATAISELNEMEYAIPEGTPKTVASASGIRAIARLLDDAHTLATTSLGDAMYYNQHHDDHGKE